MARQAKQLAEAKKKKRSAAKKKPAGPPPQDELCAFLEKETGYKVTREHKFHSHRKWRFDYCLLDIRLAIEQEGGVYTGGRHTRPSGYLKDCEKYNNAQIAGYLVLRYSPDQLKVNKLTGRMKPETLRQIKKAISEREAALLQKS